MATDFFKELDELLPTTGDVARFMQGTPVYPGVWRRFAKLSKESEDPHARVDVLLTPHWNKSATDLLCALTVRLFHYRGMPEDPDWLDPYKLSASESQVVARLTLPELVCVALPLTNWWQKHAAQDQKTGRHPLGTYLRELSKQARGGGRLMEKLVPPDTTNPPTSSPLAASSSSRPAKPVLTSDGRWFFEILSLIARRREATDEERGSFKKRLRPATALVLRAQEESDEPILWGVSRNRKIQTSVWRSVPAIKADAARRVFNLDASEISWAVIDSGIDATHKAFRKWSSERVPLEPAFVGGPAPKNHTRVVETYDFTKLRKTLALQAKDLPKNISNIGGSFDEIANELRKKLSGGRFIDWAQMHKLVRIHYDPQRLGKSVPVNSHGTHVAGIMAADWPRESRAVTGVCPGLKLYDLRVVDNDGVGDEFSILAAIDFVRYRNSTSEQPIIHGVNISMSISHDVRSYACGRTPVCEACDRLVGSGVVVVAAAGNRGYAQFRDEQGQASMGYRSSGITDPGNCESVITVGATHRYMPHQYGVSFFSSRGPTGDGRFKPDLVAPGEKITAPVPGDDEAARDGTSMAAPHVSGAAALLMARYSELIGDPQRIKKILCQTATDLGRERYFQGAGMLDILRALQSV